MQTEQLQTPIQPIVNGSVNQRLTPELFNDIEDIALKRQVIWNILISIDFAHSFKEVDHAVFEKSDFRSKYANPEIFEHTNVFAADHEVLNHLFVTVKKEFQNHENRMLVKTANHRYALGKKIHQAQKELGFGGWIELDKDRMQGYIQAGGSWNDFKASDVSAAIGKLHDLAPRMNYGVNNPNTGNLIHKWKSVHRTEYVVMDFDFIGKESLEEVKEFYSKHWEPIGRRIKADSIRYEIVEHGNGYFGMELVMWWD